MVKNTKPLASKQDPKNTQQQKDTSRSKSPPKTSKASAKTVQKEDIKQVQDKRSKSGTTKQTRAAKVEEEEIHSPVILHKQNSRSLRRDTSVNQDKDEEVKQTRNGKSQDKKVQGNTLQNQAQAKDMIQENDKSSKNSKSKQNTEVARSKSKGKSNNNNEYEIIQPQLDKKQSVASSSSRGRSKIIKEEPVIENTVVEQDVKMRSASRSQSPDPVNKQQKQANIKDEKQDAKKQNLKSVKPEKNKVEFDEPMQIDTSTRNKDQQIKNEKQLLKQDVKKIIEQPKSLVNHTQKISMTPTHSNFIEFNKLVSNLLNPTSAASLQNQAQSTSQSNYSDILPSLAGFSHTAGPQLNPFAQNYTHKFTPKVDKLLHPVHNRSVERSGGISGLGDNPHTFGNMQLQTIEQLQLKRKTSLDDSYSISHSMQLQGQGQNDSNLLERAILGGPQKHINRQEAFARAGKIKPGQTNGQGVNANGMPGQFGDKKSLMQMAALGNFQGVKAGQPAQFSKQDLLKDKEIKNKKALQENSLVQFAENQPDLYAPITLPFFNQYKQDQEKLEQQNIDLKNGGVSLKQEKHVKEEDSSIMKLRQVESYKDESGELRDLLIKNENGQIQQSISELEPFLIQLPSTLPFNLDEKPSHSSNKNQTDYKSSTNQIERLIENLNINSKDEQVDPPKIGKIRIMKSGKVVLRMQDPNDQSQYIDFELIKGIQTNFYQELISVDVQKSQAHFLAPLNHKLIATPDLDSIFV
eukprot:403355942